MFDYLKWLFITIIVPCLIAMVTVVFIVVSVVIVSEKYDNEDEHVREVFELNNQLMLQDVEIDRLKGEIECTK